MIAIQRALSYRPIAPNDRPKGISEQVSNFAIVLVVPSRGIFDAQQIRTSERPFGSSILVSPARQTFHWNPGKISIIDSLSKAGLACYIWDRELMARTSTGTLRQTVDRNAWRGYRKLGGRNGVIRHRTVCRVIMVIFTNSLEGVKETAV